MAFFEQTDITNKAGDELYLRRTHILPRKDRDSTRGFPFAIKLHRICRSDLDRHTHNHPFGFVTIILKGGYTETLNRNGKTTHRWYTPGSVLRRTTKDFHRLTLLPNQETWTLVFFGRKKQSWGFDVDGEYWDHEYYLSSDKAA